VRPFALELAWSAAIDSGVKLVAVRDANRRGGPQYNCVRQPQKSFPLSIDSFAT
jgi:hypothetical protein